MIYRRIQFFLLLSIHLLSAAESTDSSNTTLFHLSTWPSHAEISLGKPPQASNLKPLYTPAIIPIPKDSNLQQVYLFLPGYQTVSRWIQLQPAPHNHFFIHLQEESDSLALKEHRDFLRKRQHKKWGNHLRWISAAPAAATVLLGWLAQREYDQALTQQKRANASILTSGEHYEEILDQYHSHIQQGDRWKKKALLSLSVTLLLLSGGIVLNF